MNTAENIHKIVIESNRNTFEFRGVNANDITDKLTIKILTVNGRDAEQVTESGYVRIISGN